MHQGLLDELKEAVGPGGWTSDAVALEPHLTEWRQALRGNTSIMLSPATTAQVAAIVTICAQHGVGLVPQGGNTGLCGGAIPDDTGQQVLLSISRLNKIRCLDVDDFSITVDAGCVLADIQDAARNAGLLFPLSLAAEGSCQIGGNLSTNAGGINVIRYGTARDQVLGLEVVLADGTVWNGLRALRKDTAGYDMKQVFVGSEGTLGIITAATLKLYPDPGETMTAMLAMPSGASATELLGLLRGKFADRIQAFELLSERCLRFVTRHIPGTRHPFETRRDWYALIEVAAGDQAEMVEAVLAEALERNIAADAIVAKSAAESDALWRLRHSISEAQRPEGVCLKHDIAVPIGELGRFLERGQALVARMQPEARLVAFGHVGDGNLHYNVVQPRDTDGQRFRVGGRALTLAIYDLVAELGGTISAEHGIGVTKKADLERYRSATEIGLMRTLKKALDPRNTLNPGKVI
jgi:FAD/FMN-containing dehydrogenase